MNVKNVEKWKEALLSGKYKQGVGVLRTPEDKYCCLGVACDISGLGEWRRQDNGDEWDYVVTEKDYSDTVMPKAVQKWLGLHDVTGVFEMRDPDCYCEDEGYLHVVSLAYENDKGKSFKEIVDIINTYAGILFGPECSRTEGMKP